MIVSLVQFASSGSICKLLLIISQQIDSEGFVVGWWIVRWI